MNIKPYLLGFDFDGTAFDTFSPSSQKIGIAEAYEIAIRDMFGDKVANLYHNSGGHAGLGPTQIIERLFLSSRAYDILSPIKLILKARKFYMDHFEVFNQYIPDGKGVDINSWKWRRNTEMIAEILVRRKLHYLLPQIGTLLQSEGDIWPQPTKGFIDFWKALSLVRDKGVANSNSYYFFGTRSVY